MAVHLTDNTGSFWWQVRTGWQRQSSVIQALIYKEFKMRLGISRLGLVWTLLEPIVAMTMISAIWLVIGRDKIDGVHTMLFIGAGFIIFLIIRLGMNVVSKAILANEALLNYPQVKPIDTVLARFIHEMALHTIAAVLLFFVLWWFLDLVPVFHDPLMMVTAYAVAMMMSLGVSLLLAIYGTFYPGIMKAVEFTSRPLMIGSAVIFSINDLPPVGRQVLAWNPIVHIIQQFRFGAFGTKLFAGHDILYPAMLGIILLGVGILAYYANRYKLIQK